MSTFVKYGILSHEPYWWEIVKVSLFDGELEIYEVSTD